MNIEVNYIENTKTLEINVPEEYLPDTIIFNGRKFENNDRQIDDMLDFLYSRFLKEAPNEA